jgi:hypothetical protein
VRTDSSYYDRMDATTGRAERERAPRVTPCVVPVGGPVVVATAGWAAWGHRKAGEASDGSYAESTLFLTRTATGGHPAGPGRAMSDTKHRRIRMVFEYMMFP